MWTEHADSLELSPGAFPAEFVPAAFAPDVEQAREMKMLLEWQNIPTLIEEDGLAEASYTTMMRGIPVMVPSQMHDLASEVLARSQREADYRDAYDDEEEEDEDVDLLDDDEEDDDDYDDEDFDDLDDDYDDDDFDEEDDEDDLD